MKLWQITSTAEQLIVPFFGSPTATYNATVRAAALAKEVRCQKLREKAQQAFEAARPKSVAGWEPWMRAKLGIPKPLKLTPKQDRTVTRRVKLLKRFKGLCFYCECALTKDTITFDHLIPRSVGGRGWDNYVASCRPCNTAKGNRLPTADELARVKNFLPQ